MSVVMMAAVAGHGSAASGAVVSESLPDWPMWVWMLWVVIVVLVVCPFCRAVGRFVRG